MDTLHKKSYDYNNCGFDKVLRKPPQITRKSYNWDSGEETW